MNVEVELTSCIGSDDGGGMLDRGAIDIGPTLDGPIVALGITL